MKRPTMADVAGLAGVSKATVSLVLSGRADRGAIRISALTREKVFAAAQQLGYNVNVLARSMSSQQTHTLGLVTYDFGETGPAVIMGSAQQVARSHGYYLMVSSVGGDLGAIHDQIMQLDSWRVDGIFVAVAVEGASYRRLRERLQLHIPVVWLEGAAFDGDANSVGVDNVRGGEMAVEHLLSLGHRQIGSITGPPEALAAQQRLQGYRRALAAAGVGVRAGAIVEGDWTPVTGNQATHRLLEQYPELTALVAQNDLLAVGAMRALRERGRRVPEDVSVIGFDDIALAPYLDPPLTTLRQDLEQVGRLAIDLLLEAQNDPDLKRQVTIRPELVVRRSTCPPVSR